MTPIVARVPRVRARWVDAVWRDLRHAVRALLAARSYSVIAVIVLSLSIGASTVIFSVVDVVLLRDLPYPEAGRLVGVTERPVGAEATGLSTLVTPQTFLDWRDRQDVFTDLTAIGYTRVTLRPDGAAAPEMLEAQSVTADFFNIFGAPAVGRAFGREHEVHEAPRVVVISHRLWQRRFDGVANVVGRTLPGVDGAFEIVGVMPATFTPPVDYVDPDIWLPLTFSAEDRVRASDYSYHLRVIGRLRPGVTVVHAQERVHAVTMQLAAETPRWYEGRAATVELLHEYRTRRVRGWMYLLVGAVACVLTLACVNVATLMLVRHSTRARALAVRAALGATRADIARLLLTEGLVLSVVGASAARQSHGLGSTLLGAPSPPICRVWVTSRSTRVFWP